MAQPVIDNLAPSESAGPKPRSKTTVRSSAGLAKYIRSLFSSDGVRRFFENNNMDTGGDHAAAASIAQTSSSALFDMTFSERVVELQSTYARLFQGPEFEVTQSISIKNVIVLLTTSAGTIPRQICTAYGEEDPNLNISSNEEGIVFDCWHYAIFYLPTPLQPNQGTSACKSCLLIIE